MHLQNKRTKTKMRRRMDLRTVQNSNPPYRRVTEMKEALLSRTTLAGRRGRGATEQVSPGTSGCAQGRPRLPHSPLYHGVCVVWAWSHPRTQRGSASGARGGRLGTTVPRRLCETGREAAAVAGRARAAASVSRQWRVRQSTGPRRRRRPLAALQTGTGAGCRALGAEAAGAAGWARRARRGWRERWSSSTA